MQAQRIVSREEWIAARRVLLAREKAHLKAQDEIARQRREMPWVLVEKDYVFEGPNGRETLADLFQGRSQLIVKHFMFGPDWEEGCVGCSYGADQDDGSLVHLVNHDVMFVAVSRAPYAKIAPFHRRMGWRFKWVSSAGSDFNFDYNVSFGEADKRRGKVFYNFRETDYALDELPGYSVFARDDEGRIFHTYSVFGRGTEHTGTVYGFLDLTPKGRAEPPGGNLGDWMRHHDKYEEKPANSCCHG